MLGSDLQGECSGRVQDFDEWNGIIINLDRNYFHCWRPDQPFSPMILENHLVSFDFRNLKAVEAGFDLAFPLEKPTQGLVHFHEVNRTYALFKANQSRHGLKALNGGWMKGHHRADVVKAEIVSDRIIGEMSGYLS